MDSNPIQRDGKPLSLEVLQAERDDAATELKYFESCSQSAEDVAIGT